MRSIEDLTKLAPKRLERELGKLTREALPCVGATVFDGTPSDGLTVGLRIESQGRRDVLDLARVLKDEPSGHVVSAWALLLPSRGRPHGRLLLRVRFERPVKCSFVLRFDVSGHNSDPLRARLPILLAADRFALAFDGPPEPAQPLIWLAAPTARGCVLEVLAPVGLSV